MLIILQNNRNLRVITDDIKKDGDEVIVYSENVPNLLNIDYDEKLHKQVMIKLYDKYSRKRVF